jgi:prepilin-type N-terminal cleavage/methylation domain-containing protein
MHMSNKQCSFLNKEGFTLIEIIIAIVILAIIALGALGYQYYATMHTSAAWAQLTAARTAQSLLDNWKSTGGSVTYNPAALNPDYTVSGLGSNTYEATFDNLPMYLQLLHVDIERDETAQITLRKITVQVNWSKDRSVPSGQADQERSMIFSTYVRVDASGG